MAIILISYNPIISKELAGGGHFNYTLPIHNQSEYIKILYSPDF
jgi:hypothetical protein